MSTGTRPARRPPTRLIPVRRPAAWRGDVGRRRMLGCSDALGLTLCTLVFGLAGRGAVAATLTLAAIVVIGAGMAKPLGLYDRDHRSMRVPGAEELPSLFTWAVLCGVVLSVLPAHRQGTLSARELGAFMAVLFAVAMTLRAASRAAWRRVAPAERVALIGLGPVGATLRRKFDLLGGLHAEVAVVLDESTMTGRDAAQVLDDLKLEHAPIDRVVVAVATLDEKLISELVAACRQRRMKLGIVPPMRSMLGTAVRLDHLAELPVVQYNTWDVSRTTMLAKRALDVGVALTGLVAVAPAMVAIAVLVRLDSPGPVLFRQRRSGRDGVPFTMLKFRSMVDGADERLAEVDLDALADPAFKLAADPRVTRFGLRLRRYSLDELPQLINIVRGDMSVVGPRPEQVELVARYSEEMRAVRLAVRPGMTGPMQVSGRGDLTFDERVAIEREYVENLSLSRDVQILAATVSAVVSARGAY